MSVSQQSSVPANREATLLSAASRVFADKGFHDAKIADIVAMAGVAQGTFYLYFKSKNDIFFRLISACCLRIIDKMSAASEKRRRLTDPTELYGNDRDFLIDLFRMLEAEEPVLKLILSDSSSLDPAIDKMLAGLREALVEGARRNLEIGIENGYTRECDTAIVAEAIVGMVYHLAFERFVRGRDFGVSLEQLAEEIVRLEHLGTLREGR